LSVSRVFGVDRELAADDELEPQLLGLLVRADDAVEAVAIGDSDGVVAELGGALDEALGGGAGLEEGVVGAGAELDVVEARARDLRGARLSLERSETLLEAV
jgi:hypothetical protein